MIWVLHKTLLRPLSMVRRAHHVSILRSLSMLKLVLLTLFCHWTLKLLHERALLTVLMSNV